MNASMKSQLRRWLHAQWMAVACLIICLPATRLLAASDVSAPDQHLLIINSFTENTPWAQNFTAELFKHAYDYENVTVSVTNLNDIYITSDSVYQLTEDGVMERYRDNPPTQVVMVGNFAFNLRDRIRQEWGDVPIILVCDAESMAPRSYYYTGRPVEVEDEVVFTPLTDLRQDYNFTFVYTPSYVEETIDLMFRLQPQIRKVIFAADRQFINQRSTSRIRKYLRQKYPTVEFERLEANDENDERLERALYDIDPTVGLILSTWFYARTNLQQVPTIAAADFRMRSLSYASRPVFALRREYVDMYDYDGCYTYDQDETMTILLSYVDRLLSGEQASHIPFFRPKSPYPYINYTQAIRDHLQLSQAPANTHYINRPPTFWEKYQWQIIAGVLVALLILVAVVLYVLYQQRRIRLLRRQENILRHMPVLYAQGRFNQNEHGEVNDVTYSMGNRMLLSYFSLDDSGNSTMPKFHIERAEELIGQLLQEKDSVQISQYFADPNRSFEISICRTGHPGIVDIFATDVTDRLAAEVEMRNLNKTLEMTLSAARIIPWRWDLKGEQITCEGPRIMPQQFDRLTGTNTHQPKTYVIPQQKYFDSIHPDDVEHIKSVYQRLVSGEDQRIKTEFRVINYINGRKFVDWLEVNAVAERSEETDEVVSLFGSLLIITARKQQEEALIDAREKAKESDRLKSAFLANMSHEIRTPLNAIVGFSNLLTNTEDESEKKEYVHIIENNNELLLQLISDILDLSKIEADTMEFNIHPTDINDLMKNVEQLITPRVHPQVKLNMVLGAPNCITETDRNRVSQVLINFLTNACKFTSHGSITFGYDVRPTELYLYVRDTGIGIAPDKLDAVFNRFVKLNTYAQGTGLGLAICQSIVQKMGGKIGVHSDGQDQGSLFWFTIPYKEIEAEKIDIKKEREIAKQKVENQMFTILVAEDNESNYLLFRSILGKEYKLIHAWDGEEAVECFKKYQPNIILMDIGMPKKNGYEAASEIRKLSATVPIIAVTAYAFSSDREQILSHGFDGYVAKPLNANDLRNQILTTINKSFVVI
jgi:signal transduction histidine kinase/CheY-like chemotaxis protein